MVGLTAGARLHLSIGPLSTKTGETEIPENFLRTACSSLPHRSAGGWVSQCLRPAPVGELGEPQVSVGAGSTWSRLLGNDHRRGARLRSLAGPGRTARS